MTTLFVVLIVLASAILGMIVLVQNPKVADWPEILPASATSSWV